MPSSTLRRLRLRLLDRLRRLGEPPSRIDAAAVVGNGAMIRASALHGPVEVGEHARVYRAELQGPVRIGRHTSLWGPEIYVHAGPDPIEIGSFCSIARHVGIHGYLHDVRRITTYFVGRNVLGRPIEEEIVTRGPTRIGHDVWIGAAAHVMPGVQVGTGAVIGAGSVVSRDVPPYGIAVGAPARVVRHRFDEDTVGRLLESCWWEWSRDDIADRAGLFTEPLTPELLDRYL